MEHATLSARLATFPAPSKRSKAGWPHKKPSPEEVAKAGFYYKPQTTGSDNVVCYLCERSLDGWEANDDPVQEHLRHSPECGWAVLMSQAQIEKPDVDNMEDPTCASIADARRATFAIGWPHESKRAWVCKTEKMVEAGWHFAPTEECEDWVSCAYCKLSLDGWEPKDNPFDEHYRRNPECPFFAFAGTTAPSKRPKAKKGRASKSARTSKASTRASTRLSTQSNVSMQSENEARSMTDIPDLDESIDTSTTSVQSNMSTVSTATNKGKRKAAGGRKAAKSKKAKTTKSTRGKKAQLVSEPEPAMAVIEPEPEQKPEMQPIQEAELQQQPDPVMVDIPSPTPTPKVQQDQRINYPALQRTSRHSTKRSSKSSQHQTSPPAPPQIEPSPVVKPPTPAKQQLHSPSPQPSPSTSDLENAPPSTLPRSSRPPPSSNPPSPAQQRWDAIDIDLIFATTSPAKSTRPPIPPFLTNQDISEQEKQMSVQEWIDFVAGRAEEDLRMEGERVVGVFEGEGRRVIGVLEAMECC